RTWLPSVEVRRSVAGTPRRTRAGQNQTFGIGPRFWAERVEATPAPERTKIMRLRKISAVVCIAALTACLLNAKDSPDKQREKIRKMADQTLTDLYKLQPTAKTAVQKAAGYAVFNNMGTNLLLLSTARGAGIAVNTKSKQDTFMKMISAGAGLGIGVKDYRVIFVFENEKALGQFMDSGWAADA